jgi:hypothetical protein
LHVTVRSVQCGQVKAVLLLCLMMLQFLKACGSVCRITMCNLSSRIFGGKRPVLRLDDSAPVEFGSHCMDAWVTIEQARNFRAKNICRFVVAIAD